MNWEFQPYSNTLRTLDGIANSSVIYKNASGTYTAVPFDSSPGYTLQINGTGTALTLVNIANPLQFKGSIAVATDFPTSATVQNGWMYRITANVTDNDVTKTNTGQSFISGDEIAWNGTNWTELGSVDIWQDDGATISQVTGTRTVTIGTGLIPDANDGAYLGTSALGFSDLFLASGGVINWNNGDVTITHSANTLTLSGQLVVSGGIAMNIVSKSADYTATASDYSILVDATGANRTITLPASSGATGRIYNIKKIDSSVNTVTIDGNASETIDGATTTVLSTQYANLTIQCDGSNWHIL